MTYTDIDDFLEGKEVSPAAQERIEELWRRGTHKRRMPGGPVTN